LGRHRLCGPIDTTDIAGSIFGENSDGATSIERCSLHREEW
jgi:hypothetical protein